MDILKQIFELKFKIYRDSDKITYLKYIETLVKYKKTDIHRSRVRDLDPLILKPSLNYIFILYLYIFNR